VSNYELVSKPAETYSAGDGAHLPPKPFVGHRWALARPLRLLPTPTSGTSCRAQAPSCTDESEKRRDVRSELRTGFVIYNFNLL